MRRIFDWNSFTITEKDGEIIVGIKGMGIDEGDLMKKIAEAIRANLPAAEVSPRLLRGAGAIAIRFEQPDLLALSPMTMVNAVVSEPRINDVIARLCGTSITETSATVAA